MTKGILLRYSKTENSMVPLASVQMSAEAQKTFKIPYPEFLNLIDSTGSIFEIGMSKAALINNMIDSRVINDFLPYFTKEDLSGQDSFFCLIPNLKTGVIILNDFSGIEPGDLLEKLAKIPEELWNNIPEGELQNIAVVAEFSEFQHKESYFSNINIHHHPEYTFFSIDLRPVLSYFKKYYTSAIEDSALDLQIQTIRFLLPMDSVIIKNKQSPAILLCCPELKVSTKLFTYQIAKTIQGYHLQPDKLSLEIAERGTFSDFPAELAADIFHG